MFTLSLYSLVDIDYPSDRSKIAPDRMGLFKCSILTVQLRIWR